MTLEKGDLVKTDYLPGFVLVYLGINYHSGNRLFTKLLLPNGELFETFVSQLKKI